MISIVLPMYNEEKYIARMLSSIEDQTYKDYEIILVNDGSNDKTEEICKEFTQFNSKFKYYYKINGGVASARNVALEKCKGDYIGFLDADDFIEDTYFENLYKEFAKNKTLDLVVCSYTQNNEKVKLTENILNRKQAVKEIIQVKGSKGYLWNKLFRKDKIDEIGLRFNENYKVVSDLPFCLRYITHSERIKYISKVLIHYSINETSMSGNTNSLKDINRFYVIKDCIEYLQSKGYENKIINEYKTIALRTASGIIIKNKNNNRETLDKYDEMIDVYSIKDANSLFVKLKLLISKILLFYYKKIIKQ